MRALWETEEIGRRLLGPWDGEEGCVFLVFRSREVFLELQQFNDRSACRWFTAGSNSFDDELDHGDDSDARSTSTIQTDVGSPALGVIRLRAPQFVYEKAKDGLPACFLFGRRSTARRADVILGRGSKERMSRIHFALGLKLDAWAVCAMSGMRLTVNDTTLVSGMPGFALWPERGNRIQVADLDFEIYCREPRVAAQCLVDGWSTPPGPPVRCHRLLEHYVVTSHCRRRPGAARPAARPAPAPLRFRARTSGKPHPCRQVPRHRRLDLHPLRCQAVFTIAGTRSS